MTDSRSPRILVCHGYRRRKGGLPIASSYCAFTQLRTKTRPNSTIASTITVSTTAPMLSELKLPCTLDPTQTANSGAPVQTFTETIAARLPRPTRLRIEPDEDACATCSMVRPYQAHGA